MNNLALVYFQQGKYAQAETLNNQTLEIRRRVRGPEHPDTLSTLSDFASMYQRQGKYALAENPAAQALTGKRHTLGPEHPDTIDSASALALSYQSQGKFAESELLAREVVEFDRKRPGKIAADNADLRWSPDGTHLLLTLRHAEWRAEAARRFRQETEGPIVF